jgi:hypothetical protein
MGEFIFNTILPIFSVLILTGLVIILGILIKELLKELNN